MTERRTQRRLTAILAADVVGYSRLMEQDEAGTLAALKARWQDVLAPLVARHNPCGTITDRSRMNCRSNPRPIELIDLPRCQRSRITDLCSAVKCIRRLYLIPTLHLSNKD